MLEAQALKEARDDPRWRRSSPEILLHDGDGSKRQNRPERAGDQRKAGLTEVFSAVSAAGAGIGGQSGAGRDHAAGFAVAARDDGGSRAGGDRSSPAARRYYERLLRKKHKHVARVALARKLLIAVYVLLHDGEGLDEDKFAAV